jgi:hypothetical protein
MYRWCVLRQRKQEEQGQGRAVLSDRRLVRCRVSVIHDRWISPGGVTAKEPIITTLKDRKAGGGVGRESLAS